MLVCGTDISRPGSSTFRLHAAASGSSVYTQGLSKRASYLRLGAEKLKEHGAQMFNSLDELEWLIGVCWKFG